MVSSRKLRGLMAENEISQIKLAELLKISATTLRRKMKKENNFTLSEAEKISILFNKTIDEIFISEDSKGEKNEK